MKTLYREGLNANKMAYECICWLLNCEFEFLNIIIDYEYPGSLKGKPWVVQENTALTLIPYDFENIWKNNIHPQFRSI